MSKHTPGPWEYRAAQNYEGFAVFPAFKLPSLAAVKVHNFPGQTEANARLIAAAPQMYDALEALDKWWTASFPSGPDGEPDNPLLALCEDTKEIWRGIRAALKAASGE